MRANESIIVPESVSAVMRLLEDAGFECFVVGGYLRDSLLGRPTFDIDLATSATPEDVMRNLPRYSVIPTGLRHGTVTVVTEDRSLEVTTFREDGTYSDYRHPDAVRFTKTIEADLARRDFTINALAWNEKRGLIDPWGGQSDLKKGLIKAVGDADQRFREDALRIFRGLRLSAELSFCIEERTSAAMRNSRQLLQNIAPERLQVELNRLLVGENAFPVMQRYNEVLAVVIPELSNLVDSSPSLLDAALIRVSHMSKEVALRLAALFYDFENVSEILARLRYDNATIDRVNKLIAFQAESLCPDKRSVWRALYHYGQKDFLDGLRLRIAAEHAIAVSQENAPGTIPIGIAESPKTGAIAQIAGDLIRSGRAVTLKDLAIDGYDLLNRGYEGKEIGETLEKLLEKVCVENYPNERESLLLAIEDKGDD